MAREGPPAIGRLRAHRIVDLYAMQVAPALAATLVGLSHLPDPAVAVALGLLALGANLVLARARFPFHLMPVARFVVRVCAPVIAAALVIPVAAYGGHDVAIAALVPSIVAATLMTSLGAWFKARFDATTEVRVGVIGTAADAAALSAEIRDAGVCGFRVAVAVEGQFESLRAAIREHSLDLLVVASGERGDVFERASGACLGLPMRMLELSQFCEDVLGHVPAGSIGSGWFQYLVHPRFRADAAPGKRAFDLIVASLVAIVAAPLVGALGLAIRLADGGPALYRQRRVGARGREFTIVKLRTMEGGEVTRIGRLLRVTHLDELPQLWNVLRGEMTLVGPRPERPGRVAELERRYRHYERRLLAKPGITGWAQVRCGYAGSDHGAAWKLSHDLYYLKHRSLLGDALLLLETVRTVGEGGRGEPDVAERRFVLGEASTG